MALGREAGVASPGVMTTQLLQKAQAGLGEAMTTSLSMDTVHSFRSETLAGQLMSSQEEACGQGMELLCWGSGDLGQTGRGGARDVSPLSGTLDVFSPGKLGQVKLVACGSCHSVVVTVDNRIFTWGNGSSGQLGDGEKNMKDSPVEVFLPPGRYDLDGKRTMEVAGIACGSRHTFIWATSGEAFSFGNNFYAQLGYNFRKMDFKENQLVPHLFRNLPLQRITQVACGERHTLFALEDGSVAACGANDYGQIGSRSCEDAAVPRFVEDLDSIVSIACGANHNLALSDDGKVYSWGRGQEGQLGQGPNVATLSAPCLLQSKLLSPGVLQVDAGDSYSAALTADGDLVMWGRNSGVMDVGRPGSQRVWSPERVPLGAREACAVSCGTWHALALVRPRAERRRGNRESHFTETGALFKEDSNHPEPMELQPRENSKQASSANAEPGGPVNRSEVTGRCRSGNALSEDMEKTDLLGAGRADDTSKREPPGNGRSSITRRADDGGAAAPMGTGFRADRAGRCLTPPLSPWQPSLSSGQEAPGPSSLPQPLATNPTLYRPSTPKENGSSPFALYGCSPPTHNGSSPPSQHPSSPSIPYGSSPSTQYGSSPQTQYEISPSAKPSPFTQSGSSSSTPPISSLPTQHQFNSPTQLGSNHPAQGVSSPPKQCESSPSPQCESSPSTQCESSPSTQCGSSSSAQHGSRPLTQEGCSHEQVSSGKPLMYERGSDTRKTSSSRGPRHRPVPGSLTSRVLSPGPSHRPAGPRSFQHQSPIDLDPHPHPQPRPRPRPTSTASQPGAQVPSQNPARPVHKQATFSSGTAWKDVSMSADPVLSHKRAATAKGQKR